MALHHIDKAHGARRMGFGVSGPHGSPLVSRRATEFLIRRAFELDVRLFDTGPSYGAGEAERRLGEALQSLPRMECIVSTKAGVSASGLAARHRDFSVDAIRRSVEGSLQRLRINRVDWLFLHGPAASDLTDELLKALETMRHDGQVVTVGVCGRGHELDAAVASGLFGVFMTPVHAGLTCEGQARLKAIRDAGAELVGIEALKTALPAYPSPNSPGAAWRLARAAVRGPAHGSSPDDRPETPHTPEACLRWALGPAGAHRVVTSTTRTSHLEANVRTIESLSA